MSEKPGGHSHPELEVSPPQKGVIHKFREKLDHSFPTCHEVNCEAF